jgi:hypothetical protein
MDIVLTHSHPQYSPTISPPFAIRLASSQVAFYDIGEPKAQYLDVPGNLASDMFPYAKRVGGNIHTNSWGSDANVYSGGARQIDEVSKRSERKRELQDY